jgi:DNA-binding LacI/PurR family transcriptional regulator
MSDTLSNIRFSRQASVRQQLSRQLREMIVSGKMSEGDRLPSNQNLAEQWNVAASSVQAAMTSLVKEGLLKRARKRGTFVAKRTRTLTAVALYLADDIWHMRAAAFRRAVVTSLSEQLRARKIQPHIWSDSRPQSQQSKPWPDLAQAAEQRQIQAVLMCSGGTPAGYDWLSRLSVPLISLTNRYDHNCVGVDAAYGERLAAAELARKGCRSVGMITPVKAVAQGRHAADDARAQSTTAFREAAAESGMEIRDEWIRLPASDRIDEPEAEHFGYEQMKQVLALTNRPDGMFVTHDWVARGALMAVLENRIKVPQKLKLVLHRNLEIGLFCPIEASFLDFQVSEVAAGMISLMDAQLRGEECASILVRPRISRMAGV